MNKLGFPSLGPRNDNYKIEANIQAITVPVPCDRQLFQHSRMYVKKALSTCPQISDSDSELKKTLDRQTV